MSGLETAIRNALDRSDRTDRDTRARIYQSARQALEAGLQKQGISDRLIVMQQRQVLERKIDEIEAEELARLTPPPVPEVEIGGAQSSAVPLRTAPVVEIGGPEGARSDGRRDVKESGSGDLSDVSAGREIEAGTRGPEPQIPVTQPLAAGRGERSDDRGIVAGKGPGLNDTPERAAKPRRRRGILSQLLTWTVTLAVVAVACWWFYRSGMVQSFIEEAMKSGGQLAGAQSGTRTFDPRQGFSGDWKEVFTPSGISKLRTGAQAQAEAVTASEGQAVRVLSSTSGEAGDVSVEVPADILKEMAGKTSTIAVTLQSGSNGVAELAIRCDFGSLGTCNRHRFTATQEKQDALFLASFERSLAPNRPGRLILNAGISGQGRPILIYSVRILTGR